MCVGSIEGCFIVYKSDSLPKYKYSERISFFFYYVFFVLFCFVLEILDAIPSKNWALERFRPGMECSCYTKCKWNRSWIHVRKKLCETSYSDGLAGRKPVWTLENVSSDPFISFHVRKLRYKEAKRLVWHLDGLVCFPHADLWHGQWRHQAKHSKWH